jgi:hypothetical protein
LFELHSTRQKFYFAAKFDHGNIHTQISTPSTPITSHHNYTKFRRPLQWRRCDETYIIFSYWIEIVIPCRSIRLILEGLNILLSAIISMCQNLSLESGQLSNVWEETIGHSLKKADFHTSCSNLRILYYSQSTVTKGIQYYQCVLLIWYYTYLFRIWYYWPFWVIKSFEVQPKCLWDCFVVVPDILLIESNVFMSTGQKLMKLPWNMVSHRVPVLVL